MSIAPENTVVGKVAKEKEKELETWLRGLPRMDEMVEDYGIDIPLWEKIMDQQGSVCCAWEKTGQQWYTQLQTYLKTVNKLRF